MEGLRGEIDRGRKGGREGERKKVRGWEGRREAGDCTLYRVCCCPLSMNPFPLLLPLPLTALGWLALKESAPHALSAHEYFSLTVMNSHVPVCTYTCGRETV